MFFADNDIGIMGYSQYITGKQCAVPENIHTPPFPLPTKKKKGLEIPGGWGVLKVKVKVNLFNVGVPSVVKLVSMEADGAPFTHLPLSVLCFTDI